MKKTTIVFFEYLEIPFVISITGILLLKFFSLENLFSNLVYWLGKGIIIAIIVYAVRRYKDNWSFKDLGFSIHRSGEKDIWFGFVAFCFLYIILLPLIILMVTITPLIFGFITVAWHEEIWYRGYIQGLFNRKIAPAVGLFVSFIPIGISHHFSLRIRKQIKTIIISIVLIGLSLYIYFGFHALRIQMAVHKINNKTFDQEIDNGVNPVFDHIPEGWIAPMKQPMNTIWKPLGIKGMNYFTFGKPKTVFSNYIERSNPQSPFYQAWFGVYVISSKNTCFGIENGKINIFELGKLAEYDQRAWLNAMGDPDPQARWIGFTTLDSLLIDESNRIFYEGVIETHSDLTNKITGQLTTFLGMPPEQEWQQQLSSFHPVTLKGIYGGWYDKQHQVTIVVYGCGIDSIQSKSGKIAEQYDTIKEDLIEMAKRIRIVRIENNK